MNKIILIKHFGIACILLVFTSCSNFLTIEDPDNKTVPGEYYNSAEEIEQAVVGSYVNLRRALLTNYAWLMYGEARTGDLAVNVDFYDEVAAQNLKADNKELIQLTDWEYFYDAINDANEVLEIIEKADEGVLTTYQYKLYKGEALTIKSMAYFYLARIWGSVPSAETSTFGQVTTEASIVEKAITFVQEAQGLLPWILINSDGIESTALTAVRFNKTAAIMLEVQENLWLGNNQEAYDLLKENITEDKADSLSGFALSTGDDQRTDIPANPLDESVVSMTLERLNAIYPEGDGRRESMYTISEDENKATLIVKDETILNLLTMNDLYLLFAEAAWKTGNLDEGITYLTNVAAGATEDYSTLDESHFADALLLERRRLLMGSGQRLFDLMRFGKVSTEISAFTESDVQSGAAYWPLSQASIADNSLVQNTYWSNK